ncbi:MAG: hypothetical protein GSR80_001755 [Desulfurococcales archaeon]|nr:hypothetical protein [Desulfurococcales archaeon]
MGEEGGGKRARGIHEVGAECYSVDVLGVTLYIGYSTFSGDPGELALLSRRAEERGVVLVGLPRPRRPCEVLQAYLYTLEYTLSGRRRLVRPSLLTAGILLGTLQARKIADIITRASKGDLFAYAVSHEKDRCASLIAEVAGVSPKAVGVAELACKREDLHTVTRNYLALAR